MSRGATVRRGCGRALSPWAIVAAESAGRLTVPMPGRIVRVWCENGARVARGAPLLTAEAVKMEHTVAAPSDGRVARVKFAVGDWVDEGESPVNFEAAPDSA